MAATAFSRFIHLRNLANINNASIFGTALNTPRRLITTSSNDAPVKDHLIADIKDESDTNQKSKKKMSKAMAVYLQRAREHEEFMKKEVAKYEIGKRHLANMMGVDADNFTQADIDKSIEYLFPSGLYDWRARPMMRPAAELFPARKEAEFDESGRPFHSMFYTGKPNYYEMLYNIVDALIGLNVVEDKCIAKGESTSRENKMDTLGSCWLTKPELEKALLENLTDSDYEYFLTTINRLLDHPFSINATDVLMKYRKPLTSLARNIELLPTEYDANGRPFVKVTNCARKSSRGEVIVWGNGTGNITINGQSIMYFNDLQCREQERGECTCNQWKTQQNVLNVCIVKGLAFTCKFRQYMGILNSLDVIASNIPDSVTRRSVSKQMILLMTQAKREITRS